MPYEVLFTRDAERDLEEIYDFIRLHDSQRSADYVLDRLLAVTDTLSADPSRGSTPKELRDVGMTEFNQIFFKPYRLIYRRVDRQVIVYLVADGRRDMQTLLLRRLTGG